MCVDDDLDRILTDGIHQAPKLSDIKICTTPTNSWSSGTLTEKEREKIVQAFEEGGKMEKAVMYADGRCAGCEGKGFYAPIIGDDAYKIVCTACKGASKVEKSTAFVDRRCPVCDGKGHTRKAVCVRCNGTGMVGSYEEVEVKVGKPDAFNRMFKAARERSGASMRTVAHEIGVSVSRLSDLECGRGAPRTAEEQEKMITWWMSCKPEVLTVVGHPGMYIVKQEQEPLHTGWVWPERGEEK